jgi:hypothetical protein
MLKFHVMPDEALSLNRVFVSNCALRIFELNDVGKLQGYNLQLNNFEEATSSTHIIYLFSPNNIRHV